MTIVCATRYEQGRAVGSVSFDQETGGHGESPPTSEQSFDWIGLHAPSESEMDLVARRYGLHPLAVEDALSGRQLPKVETYPGHLFITIRTAALEQGKICYGETAIFVGRHFIITVRLGSERGHASLRAHLEANPALLAHGSDYVLHAILDYIVDGYFPVIDTLEDDVLAMEARLLDRLLSPEELFDLFSLRRDLVRFYRLLGPSEEMVGHLINIRHDEIDKAVIPYFRDILDHARRAGFRITGLKDTLTGTIEASSLLEQQRQGAITRQLAAWAAILAVPTAIAGIYGMNFENMPELHWKYGYFFITGLMAVMCIGLYLRFRKSRWL
ncbi:magnesium and cobalt transport protein CorA [Sphingobium sp. CR28]|uniref:magnesium and cobalt transport protein CorA n=1 Tax=Sphingobium sp. CR28 TaxID=3400272 RepID=UPI003FEF3C48